MQETNFPSADGISTIYAYIWHPADGTEIRGILQLIHGFAEHALCYKDFAEHMAQKGYIVCAHDQLGHGRTASSNAGSKLGYIGKSGHKLLAKDTYRLTMLIQKKHDSPITLLGFGIGSLVARYVSSLWGMEYNGAVFCGTSCGGADIRLLYRMFSTSKLKRGTGRKEALWVDKRLHKSNNKAFRNSEHGTSWLTRDSVSLANYENDPLCGFPLTYGACLDLLKLTRITNSRGCADRTPKNLPIFILSGLEDPMGDFGDGVIKVYNELVGTGCGDVEIKLYENARHDIMFEINRQEVYDDILEWLEGLR
ncbi:MAG: alpha/beta hydrolase [Defluviitaleaceae bacterium]|nr:alpha/beta hydrolase [Defluviitaleaceae bacterium]